MNTEIDIKITKEDKDFIYFENEYGISFVASKHAYFEIKIEGG